MHLAEILPWFHTRGFQRTVDCPSVSLVTYGQYRARRAIPCHPPEGRSPTSDCSRICRIREPLPEETAVCNPEYAESFEPSTRNVRDALAYRATGWVSTPSFAFPHFCDTALVSGRGTKHFSSWISHLFPMPRAQPLRAPIDPYTPDSRSSRNGQEDEHEFRIRAIP